MFKNLLTLVFLSVFALGAQAQNINTHKFDALKLLPVHKSRHVMTSRVDLKAGEYWDGYWDGTLGEYSILLGVEEIPMVYDCAAMFPAGSAKVSGKTIGGIRFGFPDSKNIADVKVWLSTTLPATPEEADIICQKVTDVTGSENPDDELNEVRFDTPYKTDPDKDLYVGYSFTVTAGNTDAEKFPIIIDSSQEFANGLLLKFGGGAGEWDDYNGYGFGVLSVQMLLSGEMYDDAASVKSEIGTFVGEKGSKMNIPLLLENSGKNPVSDVELTLELNGTVSTVEVTPSQPVEGMETTFEYNLDIEAPAETGSYELKVTVSKVNGVDNPVKAVAKGNVFVVSRIVERIPLFEEFTGMWCGYCPKGTIAMEKLRQTYGNKISLVAVHVNDDLYSYDYADVAQNVSCFPASHINRKYMNVDPYFGFTKNTPFAIKDVVDECMSGIPTARIEASAVIDGDVLTATSYVEFLYSGDASNFAVAYILTEDGLYDDYWLQANNYSDSSPEGLADEPLFKRWKDGPGMMSVEYNETAVAALGILRGVDGSIPQNVEEGVKNSNSVYFNLNDYAIIQNRDRLNLITVLFDKSSGEVMNSNFVPLNPDANGIECTESDESTEQARYTADGRRILLPEKGINIIKCSDGTVRKVVVE